MRTSARFTYAARERIASDADYERYVGQAAKALGIDWQPSSMAVPQQRDPLVKDAREALQAMHTSLVAARSEMAEQAGHWRDTITAALDRLR